LVQNGPFFVNFFLHSGIVQCTSPKCASGSICQKEEVEDKIDCVEFVQERLRCVS